MANILKMFRVVGNVRIWKNRIRLEAVRCDIAHPSALGGMDSPLDSDREMIDAKYG